MPYGSKLHIPPTNLLLLAAKPEPYKKAYLVTKNIEEFSGKTSEELASRKKKDKTEKAKGLGRKTREEIVKWNQKTALRFRTGGRHQTSPASLRGQTAEQLNYNCMLAFSFKSATPDQLIKFHTEW